MVDTASVVVMVSCVTASGVVLASVEGPTVDTTSNVADERGEIVVAGVLEDGTGSNVVVVGERVVVVGRKKVAGG